MSRIAHFAMINAGVPAKFKPQTIRSAVASAAKDYGASMEDILNQGRWSDKAMFLKFYYRGRFQDRGHVKILRVFRRGLDHNFLIPLSFQRVLRSVWILSL